MKILILLAHKIVDLFFRNRLVFTIFIISQIIITYSYLFFFNIAFTNYTSYIANYSSIKTITLNFSEQSIGTIDSNLINILRNNGIVDIEDIRLFFSTDSSKKDYRSYFVSYLNPDKVSVFKGNPISEENVQNSDHVIVINDSTVEENLRVGDTMQIDGKAFEVIGVRPVFTNMEIPYTTGLKCFSLIQAHVILPPNTTDNQKEELGKYINSHFEGVQVELPRNILSAVLVKLFFPLVTSAFVAIVSVLSLLYMYKYMVEKIRWSYLVMRLCGCSLVKGMMILYSQLLIIFSGGFLIGMIIFHLTKNIIITMEIENTNLIDLNYLFVYVFFIVILTVVFAPFIYTFGKKELVRLAKEYDK